jgi:hypothetical protein
MLILPHVVDEILKTSVHMFSITDELKNGIVSLGIRDIEFQPGFSISGDRDDSFLTIGTEGVFLVMGGVGGYHVIYSSISTLSPKI